MDLYGQKEVNYNNPLNRFMCCFCKSYEVDKGWGCGCCGCRAFPFSCGIALFAVVYLISSISDVYDIITHNDLSSSNKLFKLFFAIKLGGDLICIIGSVLGLASIKGNYCLSVWAYYLVFLSFLLNTSFCVYILTVITTFSFWKNLGLFRLFTLIFWYVLDYFLLIYCWICFCNMVDINRKKSQNSSAYQFGF
jgi:hypothetical protein